MKHAAYILKHLCPLCAFVLASLCYAQDDLITVVPYEPQTNENLAVYSYAADMDSGRRFLQHISWQGSAYARRYEIIVERQSGGRFAEAFRETTVQPFAEFSLEGGIYRYKVISYDFLNRAASQSGWEYITVVTVRPPLITDFSPGEFVLGEAETLQIVVRGQNFSGESRVFLREIPRGTSPRDIAKAKIITPSRIQTSRDFTMLVLTVDASLFKAAGYEIHIINPGEFQTAQGIFLAKKPPAGPMFFASLGYSPFFPLSQSVLFENFPQKFFPAGAYGRFGIVPFKFTWGNLGADLSAFVDFLSYDWPDFQQRAWMLQTHLNALYQKKLLDTLVFNARLGGGITSILDFRYIYDDETSDGFNSFYISASGEASAQWFPFRSGSFAGNLFAEAGFRMSAVFTPEETLMSYIGITVGFGAKF